MGNMLPIWVSTAQIPRAPVTSISAPLTSSNSSWVVYADINIGFALFHPNTRRQVVLKEPSNILAIPSAVLRSIALVPGLPDPWNNNEQRNNLWFRCSGPLGLIRGLEVSASSINCSDSQTMASKSIEVPLKANMKFHILFFR